VQDHCWATAGLGEDLLQAEGHCLEADLSGLDLGQVEDVVDHRQQCFGRCQDDARELGLLGWQVAECQQLRHPDDPVQRRADLVADRGEEVGLHVVGAVGFFLGDKQFAVLQLDAGARFDHTVEQVVQLLAKLAYLVAWQWGNAYLRVTPREPADGLLHAGQRFEDAGVQHQHIEGKRQQHARHHDGAGSRHARDRFGVDVVCPRLDQDQRRLQGATGVANVERERVHEAILAEGAGGLAGEGTGAGR